MRRLWFWMKFVAVAGTTAVAILEILSINRKYTSSNSSFFMIVLVCSASVILTSQAI